MKRFYRGILALVSVVTLVFSSQLLAANYYWDGDNGNLWSSTAPTNWSLQAGYILDPFNTLPGSGDNVYFVFNPAFNLTNVTLGQNFTINSLTFLNDATSTITISGSNTLTLGAGGLTLQNASAAQTINANVAIGSGQTWVNSSTNAFTLGGVLSGSSTLSLGGTGLPSGTATGAFIFSNSNTYTGQITLTNAQSSLTLNGSGSLNGVVNTTAGITLNGGSSITLDNTGTNSSTRLSSGVGITSNGGTFNLLGNSSAATSQSVGVLSLNSGATSVNVTSGSAQTATLTIGGPSITRSQGGTVNFSSSGTISVPGFSAGLIGGWATIGSLTNPTGSLNYANVNGSNQVVAYSAYQTGTASVWATTDNVQVSAAQTPSAAQTVNSVYMTSNGILSNTNGNLIITNGGIIADSGTGSYIVNGNITVNNAVLIGGTAFSAAATHDNTAHDVQAGTGTPDLVVTVAGNFPEGTFPTASGGLQINTVIANASNPASESGTTSTSSNIVTVASTSQLCVGTTVTGLTGLTGTQTITGILSATQFTVSSSATTAGSATATFFSNTGLTKNGGGLLDIADGNNATITNTFSGPLTLNGGVTLIRNDANLGAVPASNTPNKIIFNGGELRSTATTTLSNLRGWYLGAQGGMFTYGGGNTITVNSYLVQGPGSFTFSDIANCAMNLNFSANSAAMTYGGATTFLLGRTGLTGNAAVEYFANSNELPASSSVTVNNVADGFLNLFTTNQTFGSLSGNGDIITCSAGTQSLTVGGNNQSTVYTGNLGHSGIVFTTGAAGTTGADHGTTTSNILLIKNGAGTQTLTGASNYSGGTQINNGGILANNTTGSGLGSGTVAVNSGAFLGGSGTIGGAVTVNSGGILAPATTPTGFSHLTITNNLTLASSSNLDLNLTGTGSTTSDEAIVSGAGSVLAINGNYQTLNISPFGFSPTLPASIPILVATGGATLADAVPDADWKINGPTTFNYSILKPSDSNGVAGEVILYLTAGNPSIVWTGSASAVWDRASTNWTPSINGGVYKDGYNVTFDDTNTSGNLAITVTASGVAPNSVTFNNNSRAYSISGGSVAAVNGLSMTGVGSVTLNNGNTFGGQAAISNGTLNIGTGGSLLASGGVVVSGAAVLNVSTSGTLDPSTQLTDNSVVAFNNASQTLSSLSGGGLVTLNGTALTVGAFSLTGTVNGSGGVTFNIGSSTAAISSSASMVYAGPTNIFSGTVQLGAANPFVNSSSVTVNAANGLAFSPGIGTFTLADLAGSGSFALQDTSSGAVTLQVGGSATSTLFSGNISGVGGLTLAGGTLALGGNDSYSGPTNMAATAVLQLSNSNALQNSTATLSANNNMLFSPGVGTFVLGGLASNFNLSLSDTTGAAINLQVGGNGASTQISGNLSGNGSFTKAGSGTLILSGTNSYLGATTVSGGVLQLSAPTALYNGNSSNWTPALITVGSGATLGLNVGGPNDFSATQVNSLITNLSTVNNNGLKAGAGLAFDTSNATNPVTIGANVANSTGPGGGSLSISKAGTATLTLAGTANGYTGTTTVTNGALILNLAGTTSVTGAVSVTNTTVGGLSVFSIRNPALSGSGVANTSLAPISLNATGTLLSTSILEIGAKIGTDPGGNNADFSYQVVAPGNPAGGTATPTNVVAGPGQINLGYLGNSNDGTGFAAYNATSLSTPRTVALYTPVPGSTTLATLQEKAQFGQGSGDHLTMGSPTANNTLILLNPIDLNGGSNRRWDSIRGVGITPEGEYSGQIVDTASTTLNIAFDGNGGLIFNNATSTYGVSTIQINGGGVFVAASDPAQASSPGALGEGTATVQIGTSTAVNPGGGTSYSSSSANLAFMTYGPNSGVGSSPTTVTARNIAVGGAGVVYANATVGGMTNDYTAMNGDIALNENPTTPTTFTARNGGRVDFGGAISGSGSIVVGNSTVEGDASATGIAVGNNGTIVFNGANTYTGNTTVSAGKLYINGGNFTTTNNVSSVSVASGATLGGLGTINAPVTVAGGGFLEGGQSGSGALTLNGSLTFTGSASIVFGGLSPVGSPSLYIASGLNTNSNTVSLDFTGSMSVGNFGLINYPGVTTSTFALPATLPNRAVGSLVVNGNELDLDITSLASIVWTGATNTKWDTSTSNFVVQGGGATHYIDNPGDTVIFDDTAGTNTHVTLNSGDVHPFSVTFANNNATYTISGSNAIAGTTGLSLTGTGTVILLNTNTYTGVTSVGAGATLQLGNGTPGNDGSISDSLGITNNGTMVYNLAGSQSYGLPINGSGALTVNSGLLVLTASSGYSGATTISGGTLQLGSGLSGHDGTVSSNITANGTLAFNVFGSSTYGGIITGTGALLKTGVGTAVLNGGLNALSGFTGPITVNQGTFQFSLGNTISVVDVPNNIALNGSTWFADGGVQHLASDPGATISIGSLGATLLAEYSGDVLYVDGVLSGSGALSLSNFSANTPSGQVATIHLTNGANTYTGAATVNGTNQTQLSIDANNALSLATVNLSGSYMTQPTLVFGAPAPTIGALEGSGNTYLQSGMTLTVGNNNSSTTYSGALTDDGSGCSLTKVGGGVLTLSGTNSFGGTTTISAGTLQIGAGGTVGQLAANGTIVNNAALVFNRSNTVTQGTDFSSSPISGSGSLTQASTGTLVLNVANTYTGPTNVVAGALVLSATGSNTGGLTSSSVFVASGASLQALGNASLGTSLASSGALSLVDGTFNTLSVGSGIQLRNAAISLELGNSGGLGATDEIAAAGAASLSGTNTINVIIPTGQSLIPGTYTLLTASSGLSSGGIFALGTLPVTFDTFTLVNSSTAEKLVVGGNVNPGKLYWTGAASANATSPDAANNWSYGVHLSPKQSNWSSVANGSSDALQIPGSSTDVVFTASNAPNYFNSLTTTLDSAYSINSLTFGVPSATGIVSTLLNTNGNLLTIGTGGLTVASATDPINPNASAVTVIGSGSLGVLASQTWSNNSATQLLTINSSIAGVSGNPVLTIGGSGAGGVVVNGVIGDGTSSGLSLVINQAGVTQLTNANTFTGGVTVNSGTLSVANGNAWGLVPATTNPADITLNGGVLRFSAGTPYGTLTASNNRGLTLGASSGTINVNFVATGAFSASENCVVWAAPFSGQGNLTITGGATPNTGASPYMLQLGPNNNYSGNTSINNAVVCYDNSYGSTYPNALPTTTVLTLANSGWFVLCNQTATQTVAGLNGDPTTVVGTTNATAAVLLTIQPNVGQTYNFAGVMGAVTLLGKTGDNGHIALTISGPGTQILTGSNTFTGATTISQGTLQIGNGGTTGSLAVGSVITDNDTLVFDHSDTVTQGTNFNGTGISGVGALVQAGSGTLVLNGTNSYSGGTTVLNGTLVLDGASSLLAGSNLTIGNGAGPGAVFAPPSLTTIAPSTQASLAPVPEPGTMELLVIAAFAGVGIWSRRSRDNRKSHI